MRKEVVLITGANGEIGHGLITYLGQKGDVRMCRFGCSTVG